MWPGLHGHLAASAGPTGSNAQSQHPDQKQGELLAECRIAASHKPGLPLHSVVQQEQDYGPIRDDALTFACDPCMLRAMSGLVDATTDVEVEPEDDYDDADGTMCSQVPFGPVALMAASHSAGSPQVTQGFTLIRHLPLCSVLAGRRRLEKDAAEPQQAPRFPEPDLAQRKNAWDQPIPQQLQWERRKQRDKREHENHDQRQPDHSQY